LLQHDYEEAISGMPHSLTKAVLEDLSFNQAQPKDKQKTLFFYHVNLGNHWGLVVIDNEQKTLEYYDSLISYRGSKASVELKKLASQITKQYKINYQFILKTKKNLQQGSDCGIWLLYFAENRVKNLNIDYNDLKHEPDMDAYRLVIRQNLAKITLSGNKTFKANAGLETSLAKRDPATVKIRK
jgi:hypothetical protein